MIRIYGRLRMAAAIVAMFGAACSDAPSAPRSGTIRVTVRTSGGDPDFDGYDVVVDPARRLVDRDGTAEFRYIRAGAHTVALERVADNCSVVGASPRSVIVERDRVLNVDFDVICETTGIVITTQASGADIPDSVEVFLDNESSDVLPSNGMTVVGRLRPGRHTVTLALRGTNCSVAGGTEISVDVAPRSVTPVRFELTCSAPVRSTRIAFAVDTTSRGARATLIEVVNLDGSGGWVVGRGRAPSWSPDGTRLAFSDARCGPNDDGEPGCSGGLVVVDPELGNLTRPLSGSEGFGPAWSPARNTIAFVGCCGAVLEPTRLFVVGLGDQPAREIAVPEVRPIGDPIWSPDGQRIAFTCVVVDESPNALLDGDLCVVDRDGSHFERLTASAASESDPAWSPNGRRIAFTRGAEVALLNLGDGLVTRLTEGREPASSPDGSALVLPATTGCSRSGQTRRTDGA